MLKNSQNIKIHGGEKLKEFLRRAKAAQAFNVRKLEIGFWDTARYPDGTPVTNVAAWNEWGTKKGPNTPNLSLIHI